MHRRNKARLGEQNQLIQISRLPNSFQQDSESQSGISTDDTAREVYRLATFNSFPDMEVQICLVAAHGFYFTGTRTIIKCFSCGATAQLSVMSDERWLRRVHHRNCSFANGNDPRNKAIQEHSPYENGFSLATDSPSSSATEFDRNNFHTRETFSYQPQMSETFSIQPEPRQTFSFHPEARETFSIQPSWNSSSLQRVDADDLYRVSEPQTFTNSNSQIRNSTNYIDDSFIEVIPSQRQQHTQQQRSSEVDLASIFPCNFPLNPQMRRLEDRLQTFFENILVWENHSQLLATPDELAEAGLYCLGERDRTKCWYCNGGLQNWNRDDDPWEEHAKWFPMCEFVLQKKGPDYVHRIVARFPDLRRPTMLNQESSSQNNYSTVRPIVSNTRIVINGGRITSGLNPIHSYQEERGPVIVDPEAERREREEKIQNALRSSGLVTQARVMGFPENAIKLALKRQFELRNEMCEHMDEFVEAISVASQQLNNREAPGLQSQSTSRNGSRTNSPSAPQTTLQEIRNITESRICKKCHTNPACIVFIPCGHIVCCQDCQNEYDQCTVCRSYIREKVRSYMS